MTYSRDPRGLQIFTALQNQQSQVERAAVVMGVPLQMRATFTHGNLYSCYVIRSLPGLLYV
jgi:hypothetical protein